MKKGLSLIFVLIISVFCFTGCKDTEPQKLDASVYLKQNVNIKLYDKTYETEQDVSTFIGDKDYLLQRYKYITFNVNNKWAYGLTLNKISFDILCNQTQTLDFTITISYLKDGENYDQKGDFYYFQKTFSAECIENNFSPITINVNSEFVKGNPQIAIVIDSSSLEKSETLEYSIANLEIFGEHASANY